MSTNSESPTPIDWAALFRAAPVALCVASLADGTILDCNERYAQLTGSSRAELIGRLAADLHVVADAAAREQIAAALDTDAAV
jgi:PAS domain S-box-containing protein